MAKVDIAYSVMSKKNFELLPMVITQNLIRMTQLSNIQSIRFDKDKDELG